MKRALSGRNKIRFIDGTFPEPSTQSPHYNAWVKADYLVYTWILNSVAKDLAPGFQYIDTAAKLWAEIGSRFDRCSGPKLFQLERELSNCAQGSQTVIQYFNHLNSLWDEINLITAQFAHNCTCGAMNKIEDRKKTMRFLLGLNDSFDAVRSQILLLEPLPDVGKVYSMVLQDEDQR